MCVRDRRIPNWLLCKAWKFRLTQLYHEGIRMDIAIVCRVRWWNIKNVTVIIGSNQGFTDDLSFVFFVLLHVLSQWLPPFQLLDHLPFWRRREIMIKRNETMGKSWGLSLIDISISHAFIELGVLHAQFIRTLGAIVNLLQSVSSIS